MRGLYILSHNQIKRKGKELDQVLCNIYLTCMSEVTCLLQRSVL